jgi:endonuclease/exonuclease/phosphatase family metal-dependent hydrolase
MADRILHTDPNVRSLRVATYNIRKSVGLDWQRRPERIIGVLAEIRPHIVAIQEADRRFGERRGTLSDDQLATMAGLRIAELHGSHVSHGWHGNAILVSKEAEIHQISRVRLPYIEPRGAIAADISIFGLRLRVVGTHFGLARAMRLEQSSALLEYLERHADGALEIVMGDFNQWRVEGGCLSILERRLTLVPTPASFHASSPVAPLDRILVGPEWEVPVSATHDSPLSRRASDHLPVWADLNLPHAPKQGFPGTG